MSVQSIRGFVFYLMAATGLLAVSLLIVSNAHAQVSIGDDGVAFPDGTLQTTGIPGTYAIGDTGPAGGFVFYVTTDGLHGLEAAPVDQSTGAEWGCWDIGIAGAEGTAMGTGARNTDDVIRGCSTTGIAAALAAEYVSPSGYFDWYLPSRDELALMYQNIGPGNTIDPNVGGFASSGIDIYWSSSEYSDGNAWNQVFGNGNQNTNYDKYDTNRVRAVRAF